MAEEKDILSAITARFGTEITGTDLTSDMPVVTVRVKSVLQLIRFLKEEADFEFLTTLCGIHYPESELPLGVVYHMHNLQENKRIRIKTFVPLSNPEVPSVVELFKAANWMERETYDFYGIIFTGHPNLKRILNVDYLDFFPMRKEFPLEDPTREDKDNRFFGR